MDGNRLKLSDKEISQAFASPTWAEKYPPILTVDQAAELAVVPKGTVYAWSSAGHLRGCSRKVGKHLRIFRDRFVKQMLEEGIPNEER